MDDELKANLSRRETWLRLLFMLLFAAIYSLAEIMLGAVVLFQFASTLITGRRNERLLVFGESLSRFIYQILRFMTYNSDDKPFPFGAWPQDGVTTSPPEPLERKAHEPGSEQGRSVDE